MTARSTTRRVVALNLASDSPYEVSRAAEVFAAGATTVTHAYDFAAFDVFQRICLAGGEQLMPGSVREAIDAAHTVLVTGAGDHVAPVPDDLAMALGRAHSRGSRIVGLSSGVFALARSGLLAGRTATTHWRLAAELGQRYPSIDVVSNVLYVDGGDVVTGAGSGATVDLCLHLMRVDHGAAHAAEIARDLVLPQHREGRHPQYVREIAGPMVSDVSEVLRWIEGRLDEPITVPDLASFAGLSIRTLARRFVMELGVSPGHWLLSRRIEEARVLLERTDLTIDSIAVRVGLSDAANLRRRFVTRMHVTPGEYRRAFRQGAAVS